MKFIKIITGELEQRYYVKFFNEIAIDADKIISVNHYCSPTTKELSDLDPRKYMSEIIIQRESCSSSIKIPAPMELVMSYLNGEVSLDAIKNYRMPAPKAPEDLQEWIGILEKDHHIKVIKKIIANGITSKSQLIQLSDDDIKALPGCSGRSFCLYMKEILCMFGLVDDSGKPVISNPFLDEPLEELRLSPRAYNGLYRAGYDTVADVAGATYLEISKVRNIGKGTLAEIVYKLKEHGIVLREESK